LVEYRPIWNRLCVTDADGRTEMRRASLSLLVLLGLAGCVTNPIPEGYSGPLSKIKDSAIVYSKSKADMFYVDRVDGKKIKDSRSKTIDDNYGQGFEMVPVIVERDVPSQLATFHIEGRTHYAAPIQVLMNKIFMVQGEVRFVPAPGKTYVVKGKLEEFHAEVWIEDVETSHVVDRKIEVNGSTVLGFLQK